MNSLQYEIRKNAALWQVFYVGSNVVQFSSLKRIRCTDWIKFNSPQTEEVTQ